VTTPVKGRPIELAPDTDVQTAFRVIARNCLTQMAANEAGATIGKDGDFVHRMRVALRRLRTALELFKLAPRPENFDVDGEFRWLAKQLGPARDWDVFIGDTLAPLRAELKGEAALRQLVRRADGARRKAYGAVQSALAGSRNEVSRYRRCKVGLESWVAGDNWPGRVGGNLSAQLTAPARDFAASALERRWKQLGKLGKHGQDLDRDDLHVLRIRAKTLRYTAEFFRSLYNDDQVKRMQRCLTGIQESLGGLNDAEVGGKLLAKLVDDGAGERGAALVKGWNAARAQARLAHFADSWKRFAKLAPYWREPRDSDASKS
jgi:CHAD domain-containing protein